MVNKVYNVLRIVSHLSMLAYLVIFSISCRQAPGNKWQPDTDAVLNVYFFHLNTRCEACNDVETETLKVLDKYFKTLLDNGTIKFKAFNIEKRENKYIVKKFQVSYTTLLLIRADGTITDFTNTSLNYASMNPGKFEELLKIEIEKNLR